MAEQYDVRRLGRFGGRRRWRRSAPRAAIRTDEGPRFCLNTSTIRGQKLPLARQIDVAIEAGYDGVEPWIADLRQHQQQGASLADLGKRLADAGLKVESAIGFANWIAPDAVKRAEALEQARAEMALVREMGGSRIAAPPAGGTGESLPLADVAARYGELLKIGANEGVTPQLELWGFSKTLSRLGELAYVASEAGRPDACVLPDVYHIYKGGSDFNGLSLFAGGAIHVFHVNDYPLDPPREQIRDADRVYPGDGEAPLRLILSILRRNGFTGALSLELFNPEYWKQDALEVARTGLAKMKAAVAPVWSAVSP